MEGILYGSTHRPIYEHTSNNKKRNFVAGHIYMIHSRYKIWRIVHAYHTVCIFNANMTRTSRRWKNSFSCIECYMAALVVDEAYSVSSLLMR